MTDELILIEVLCSRCGEVIGHVEVRADDWNGCNILATTSHCQSHRRDGQPPGSKYKYWVYNDKLEEI